MAGDVEKTAQMFYLLVSAEDDTDMETVAVDAAQQAFCCCC